MEQPQDRDGGFYSSDNGNASGSAQGRRQSDTATSLLPPSSSSEHLNNSSNSDFSPHFLVAAAAASVQAEAARSRGRPPMLHASSSISPAPPLPYLDPHTPFPMELGNRVVNPPQHSSPSHKGKAREGSNPLGRVRCCWAILSTRTERLDFLYVDPTFSQHLTLEADRIKGTSFFDYIHTEEEERTRVDMKNIIQSRTLFGSVTRCRYSSLSHIQSILRAGVLLQAAEATDYLPIDIVVNWIGEDMALCFFHAILDESAQDNNELDKTDWSNWCGMQAASVGDEECQSMWQSIQTHRTLTPSATGPQYVFQVLSAVPSSHQESTSLPNVLFSWPPPRLFSEPTSDAMTASAINFADGSYFLDDFARLAQGVDQLTLQKELSDANTSCTRRFRAKHTLTTEGMIRSVESVLIPYGSIVLACFSITYAQVLPGSSAPLSVNRRASVEVPLATFDNKSSVTAKEDASLHYNNKNGSAVPPSSSTLASLANVSISAAAAAAAKGGEKPEKNGLQGLLSRAEGEGSDVGGGSVATLAAVAAAASAQSKKCASCGASNSPEWRKGPDGTKSLCNACGLRFSRNISRARKREERALLAAEVAANGGIVPPHIRKKLGEEKKKVKRPKVSKKEEEEDISGKLSQVS